MPPMSRLRSVGFAFAALGLVMSGLIHVAGFFVDVPIRSVWPLHVGVVALGLPFAAMAQAQRRGRFFGAPLRELLAGAPPWGERALHLVLLYAVLHFGALLLATRKSLTVDLPAPPGYEIRMFSAFWMVAYLLFTLAWWKPAPTPRSGR